MVLYNNVDSCLDVSMNIVARAQLLQKENGDLNMSVISSTADAIGYISEYCDNWDVWVGELGAKEFLKHLGDVPVNSDNTIYTDFFIWNKGDDLYDIWHWIESTFDVVLGDIMFSREG